MSRSERPNSARLRDERENRHWSQKDVVNEARRLYLPITHINTVSEAERGLRRMSAQTLKAFSQIYDIPYEDLVVSEPAAAEFGELYGADDYVGFRLGDSKADAIRLTGADTDFFPPNTIHIDVNESDYVMPEEIAVEREAILIQLKEEAEQRGKTFWNGPNTRLVDYRATAQDSTEQKHLELTFGQVWWHDYAVVNQVFARRGASLDRRFLNLEEVSEGNIRDVRLTNIIDTVSVLLTTDGSVVFTKRGQRLPVSFGVFGAVSENIHPELDQSLSPDTDDELPAPFRTVMRGIREEVSPEVSRRVNPGAIVLLGLSFSLDYFHPSMLFLVSLPYDLAQLRSLAAEFPGKDYFEIKLLSVKAQRDGRELTKVLSSDNWNHGAKAALIRAVEFLDAVQKGHGIDLLEVAKRLAAGNTSWLL